MLTPPPPDLDRQTDTKKNSIFQNRKKPYQRAPGGLKRSHLKVWGSNSHFENFKKPHAQPKEMQEI